MVRGAPGACRAQLGENGAGVGSCSETINVPLGCLLWVLHAVTELCRQEH